MNIYRCKQAIAVLLYPFGVIRELRKSNLRNCLTNSLKSIQVIDSAANIETKNIAKIVTSMNKSSVKMRDF